MSVKIICRSILILVTVALTLPASAHAANEGSGAPEIIKHKRNPHHLDSVPAGSTGVVSTPITYHGGNLLPVPTVYYIWYGNWNQSNGSDTPTGQQILTDFAINIGGSPHFQINNTYSTG